MNAGNALHGKKVLMVVAHCDDELVCGWPILLDTSIRKKLLVVSSDKNNPQRTWCRHRGFVTKDVCKILDVEVTVLDHDSEFYRLSHRDGSLTRLEDCIISFINESSYDYVFTHNPFGEYGHLDHRFLFELIFRRSLKPIIITDLVMSSDWTGAPPDHPRYAGTYHQNEITEASLDYRAYHKIKKYYESRGAWTWNQEPAQRSKLYLL